jgi:hypothetical protein
MVITTVPAEGVLDLNVNLVTIEIIIRSWLTSRNLSNPCRWMRTIQYAPIPELYARIIAARALLWCFSDFKHLVAVRI